MTTTERKPHPHAEVIKAYADGYEIEWMHPATEDWLFLREPAFEPTQKYRIKPEPKKPPTTWYQVVYRNELGDADISDILWKECEAKDTYGSRLLKLIPIYTEESE
jgi:hypothetical protein